MKNVIKIILLLIMVFSILAGNAFSADDTKKHFTISDAIKFGQNLYIQPEDTVNTSVITFGGDLYINGIVNGDAITFGGNAYINGTVKGNVFAFGGKVTKGENAKIVGNVNDFGKNVHLPFSSSVSSNFNKVNHTYGARFFSFIVLSFFCVIIHTVMSRNIVKAAVELENNIGNSFITGYIALILIPVICFILFITLIGILAIPVLLLAAFIVYLVGFTSLAMYIGKNVLSVFNVNASPIYSIVAGVGLYEVIKCIPIVGTTVSIFIFIPLSLGLSLSTNSGNFRFWRKKDETREYMHEWEKFKEK